MSCPFSPKQEWCLRPSMFAPEASNPLRALLYCSTVNVSGFTYTAITVNLPLSRCVVSRLVRRYTGERDLRSLSALHLLHVLCHRGFGNSQLVSRTELDELSAGNRCRSMSGRQVEGV